MKKRDYVIVSGIAILLLGMIYFIKGFFPFGDNVMTWGDMQVQIVPLYYKFYDAIFNGGSLFVDFTSGGGISLLGILAYYILSPFTLLVLLFPRDMIVHAPTIIIGLKIVLCSITCLYFLKKHFKNVPCSIQILLSLLYAFSTYNLANYIITGWIDIVYLFPLLMSGLKDLLDGKKNKLYFVILFLSLIMNFYLAIMSLLFIIIAIFLYVKIYKVENQKKLIASLGFQTVLALLSSSAILIPTFMELGASIRTGFDLNLVLNSKLGPITDKMSYLFMSGILLGLTFLLFLKKRKEPMGKFLFSILFLLFLPLFIEPINKMWHFGSYIYYPYRFGFITIFMLVIFGAYYFEELKEQVINKSKILMTIGMTILFVFIDLFFSYKYYGSIQNCIGNLTFTKEKIGFFIMFFLFVLSIFVTFGIVILSKKAQISKVSLWVMTIIMIMSSGLLYFGIDVDQKELKAEYEILNQLSQDLPNNHSKIKLNTVDIGQNYGMVLNHQTFDHFTSLTGNRVFLANQKLGYDSYWMDTLSKGGNLFTDAFLGNHYILSDKKEDFTNEIKQYESFLLSESIIPTKEGYLVDDIKVGEATNSFEMTNKLSNILFHDTVFEVRDLKANNEEVTIPISNKQAIYLEIHNGYINSTKQKIYKSFHVYVNGKLRYQEYPNKKHVNSIYLGTYEEDINVRIEALKEVKVDYIVLGQLDVEKVTRYFENAEEIQVNHQKGKINVTVNNKNNQKYLILPVNYLDGMNAKVNNQSVEMIPFMENYIAVPLERDNNDIVITYHILGFKLGMIITMIGMIMSFLYFKFEVKTNQKWILNGAQILFTILFVGVIVLLYIIPLGGFLLSFI